MTIRRGKPQPIGAGAGFIASQLLAGYGIGRALMHQEISRTVVLNGDIVDLGSGMDPSYYRYLRWSGVRRFVAADIDAGGNVNVGTSVTQLPFRTDSFDTIICLNVLEHVFDFRAALSEIRRILRPGGVLYLRVPFLMAVHADPSDYWRYTDTALYRILSSAGFDQVSVRVHGGMFLVLLNLLEPLWRRLRVLRIAAALAALSADGLLTSVVGRTNREKFPLGYFVVAS